MRRARATTANARSANSPRSGATRAVAAWLYDRVGDAKAAMAGAARVFRGEYRTRYLYHAQMEPLSATAAVSPDGQSAEIWAGTQGPTNALNQIARLLKTDRSNLTLHQHMLGGGFGRRSQQEVIIDAVRLAKAVGKPVKLIWSREDDLTFGKFRPMTAHHIEAGLRCRWQARRLASPRGVGIGTGLHLRRSQSRASTGS